jgi:glyoxylase-like metal-dependent hydrolase (beta-lactamase superfamily II)/rhodanese-related sulfurtransferase
VLIEQFYLGCLSQASYVVADEASKKAMVIDPRRDIDEYLGFAKRHGLDITWVVLTHVHADFVPGHSELAEATDAEIAMGEAAPVGYPIRRLSDGERITLGDSPDSVVVEVLATPGHTPESITLAVYEHETDPDPHAIVTGDTLFLGDVGRPDLLGAVGRTPDEMARELYRSLRLKILPLADRVLVYPGHGAGSACGKALSTETVSTLGAQRVGNYALAPMSEDEFVAAVTDGLSEPPAYFRDDVTINRAGHAAFHPNATLGEVDVDEAVRRAGTDCVLIDVRDDQAFAGGHLRGAVNVALSGRFAEYAAAVVLPGRQVLLFGSPDQVAEGRLRLARVGVDNVAGAVTDIDALSRRGDLVVASSRLDAHAAKKAMEEAAVQVIDVRQQGELADGVIPGSTHLPLVRLRDCLEQVDPKRPVLIYCAGGYRSIAAASLLEALGFADVSDLLGGYGAWERAHVAGVGA